MSALLYLLSACASPEAARSRGGGPGADVGNRDSLVEMHAGSKPYHETPCALAEVECTGPEVKRGTTRD